MVVAWLSGRKITLGMVIALLVYAAVVFPVVWLMWRPRSGRWLVPGLAIFLVGLASYQTGIFRNDARATTNIAHLVQTDSQETRCQQVLALLTQNGVLLEAPTAEALVVRGVAWNQLPAPVREAVMACAQPGNSGSSELTVVRR